MKVSFAAALALNSQSPEGNIADWMIGSAARITSGATAIVSWRLCPPPSTGNLFNRVIGVGLTLPPLKPIADLFSRRSPDFHKALNAVLACRSGRRRNNR
jgi:hypothetical protein